MSAAKEIAIVEHSKGHSLKASEEAGELFIRMAKEGSTVSGLMDSFATAVSLGAAVWRPVADLVRQVQPHTV